MLSVRQGTALEVAFAPLHSPVNSTGENRDFTQNPSRLESAPGQEIRAAYVDAFFFRR